MHETFWLRATFQSLQTFFFVFLKSKNILLKKKVDFCTTQKKIDKLFSTKRNRSRRGTNLKWIEFLLSELLCVVCGTTVYASKKGEKKNFNLLLCIFSTFVLIVCIVCLCIHICVPSIPSSWLFNSHSFFFCGALLAVDRENERLTFFFLVGKWCDFLF